MELVEADIDSRRPHKVIGQSYEEFSHYEAFGVPTFVVNGDATFVRYMSAPTSDAQASVGIVERLLNLMAHEPDLNEFKHTRQPF